MAKDLERAAFKAGRYEVMLRGEISSCVDKIRADLFYVTNFGDNPPRKIVSEVIERMEKIKATVLEHYKVCRENLEFYYPDEIKSLDILKSNFDAAYEFLKTAVKLKEEHA
jgi:hypothetical protein